MLQIDRRELLIATGLIAAAPRWLHGADPGLRTMRLRTEGIDRPIGLEVVRPRFSWALQSAARNVRQTAYRLTAAASLDALLAGSADLFDSGRIESERCFDVPYEGHELRSQQRVWWRVQLWDSTGGVSPPSEASWFEMGLLQPSDWRAGWLAIETAEERDDRAAGLRWVWGGEPLDPRPQRFRFRCSLPAAPVQSELLLSAKDDLLGVWVDGAALALPAKVWWGTMLRLPLALKAGVHVICVAARAETSGFLEPDGGAVAALLKLLEQDGRITRLTTGPEWRTSNGDEAGWTEPGFDDARWAPAVASAARVKCEPWPPGPALLVRREFEVSRPLVRARFYATALGAYEARINGERVGDAHLSPEISVAADHVLYQCYDATKLVRHGANAIGALVGDGWYAGAFGWRNERYSLGDGPRRFLAQLVLDYTDGSREVIATGTNWRMAPSPVRSSEIYNGETYDARAEIEGWDRAGLDDRLWLAAEVGKSPAIKRVAQVGPPIRATGTMPVRGLREVRPGIFVFDFGQNFSGWCRLKVTGAAGATVELRYAEILDTAGEVDTANLRGARATDHYTLRGDPAGESYEPHLTYHGFRYVEIRGFPGRPSTDSLEGVVVHSDAPVTGRLSIENKLVQRIWENAFWSQRSNFFGVPTDCPQRDERMGWMGDIQVFLDAAAFNMDVDAFIRRFMLEVRAGQTAEGAFPCVTPQPRSFSPLVTAGWSEAGVILPWTLYRRYGERRVIEDNWEAMQAWLGYLAAANPDFLWRRRRGLDLGDWLSVDAHTPEEETTPRMLVATAYWAYCASLMTEMARAIERSADADRYAQMHASIRRAFATTFVSPDGTIGNGSQTSYVLALRFDLVPAPLRQATADKLVADIKGRGLKLSTGFLGTPYLLDVLADGGHADVAIGLLLQTDYPSWGYMVGKGATTMWERWNGDVGDVAMNSYNHYAFGAVAGFMYRRLGAIAPLAPGFTRIDVDPIFDKRIGRVRASYDSCLGRIATDLDGDARGLARLRIEIPPNAVAQVRLPQRAGMWRESRRSLEGRADLKVLARNAAGLLLELGSGRYDLRRDST